MWGVWGYVIVMMIAVTVWVICAVVGGLIGGILRQNPVAGFMLGIGFGPIGVVLAFFLEGDAQTTKSAPTPL